MSWPAAAVDDSPCASSVALVGVDAPKLLPVDYSLSRRRVVCAELFDASRFSYREVDSPPKMFW